MGSTAVEGAAEGIGTFAGSEDASNDDPEEEVTVFQLSEDAAAGGTAWAVDEYVDPTVVHPAFLKPPPPDVVVTPETGAKVSGEEEGPTEAQPAFLKPPPDDDNVLTPDPETEAQPDG